MSLGDRGEVGERTQRSRKKGENVPGSVSRARKAKASEIQIAFDVKHAQFGTSIGSKRLEKGGMSEYFARIAVGGLGSEERKAPRAFFEQLYEVGIRETKNDVLPTVGVLEKEKNRTRGRASQPYPQKFQKGGISRWATSWELSTTMVLLNEFQSSGEHKVTLPPLSADLTQQEGADLLSGSEDSMQWPNIFDLISKGISKNGPEYATVSGGGTMVRLPTSWQGAGKGGPCIGRPTAAPIVFERGVNEVGHERDVKTMVWGANRVGVSNSSGVYGGAHQMCNAAFRDVEPWERSINQLTFESQQALRNSNY
ncbi:hypothetical protein C8F04DRAFT_1240525 [Mycena alexandri]|uniref:Uncharacterized protein n=1 Tax=Mycena alexandri TaxID=1745969 RepID=A0AAD6SCG1_9AGAR|nr:hypothetical protein C8F04DRAFT_1240525 [Mycena alexandri]